MKYRTLGKTGFKISEVSLGTWQLGGKWGEAFDVNTAQAILKSAISKGINFIDTADVYNEGLSEISIGKFLKNTDHKIYVATKCGRRLNPHTWQGYNRKNITGFIEDSLKRLQLERIDLIQLHCPPDEVYRRSDVFDILEDLKKEGKIAHFGVSVEKIEQAMQAIRYPGVASIQIIYNMFRLRPAEIFFKEAFKRNVGIIVRVPLASGLLTGKMAKDSIFGPKDHRNFNRQGEFFDKGETFSGVPYAVGIEAVAELKKILASEEMTKYAIRYILDNEFISCVIPGMSSEEQIRSNLEASDMPSLSQQQMEEVKKVYDRYIKKYVHHLW
jgi:aryl-alcohol dehydrogenase-like predicted oxidoreductase